MNQSKAEKITARLLSNTAGIQYGSVSVTAKIHGGLITDIIYSVTESMRESGMNEPEDGKREDKTGQ